MNGKRIAVIFLSPPQSKVVNQQFLAQFSDNATTAENDVQLAGDWHTFGQ